MLLAEVVDQIIRKVSYGLNTDDSKFNRRAIEDQCHPWRVDAIGMSYNGSRTRPGNKLLHPDLFQQESLTLDPSIQVAGADFVLFTGAMPADINGRTNGLVFVGEKLHGVPFTQLKGVNAYNVTKDAGLIEPGKVYLELYSGYFKVWGNPQLKRMYKNFIADNPLEVTDFDPEIHPYPISREIFSLMMDIAYAKLVPEQARPGDKINDGAETNEKNNLMQNVR